MPHYAQAAAGVDARAAWRHDLVLRRLFTLKRLGAFEQAVALAEAEMEQWSHSPDVFFAIGDLLLAWAANEPERAGELLPLIESSWLKALEIGECPDLNDTVRGRGSFLAADNLAVFHASLGHADDARVWAARAQQLRDAAAAPLPGADAGSRRTGPSLGCISASRKRSLIATLAIHHHCTPACTR